MKIKKIGITGRKESLLAKETAKLAIGMLGKKYRIETDKKFLGKGKSLKNFNVDLVISFGGDGTLLAAFREIKKQTPLLGINCGNRGFLQVYNHNEIDKAIREIEKGKLKIEKRTRLEAKVDGKKVELALNEILIVPQKAGRIIRYKLKIGKEERNEGGDGLIIATPTGSTAHSLSAGGPRVKGSASVFVLVSLSPVDSKNRPLIINDHEKISVSNFENAKAELIIDGQKRHSIKKKVEIEKGKEVLLITK